MLCQKRGRRLYLLRSVHIVLRTPQQSTQSYFPALGAEFGSGKSPKSNSDGAAQPAVDVKSLHAKIGELTLENDSSRNDDSRCRLHGLEGKSKCLGVPMQTVDYPRAGARRRDASRSLHLSSSTLHVTLIG